MKSTRRILILAAALSLAMNAQAQNGHKEQQNNWFIGVGGGINMGIDGQKYVSRYESHIGAGAAVDAYIGKYFSNTLGFRAGYHGWGVSNQLTDFNKDKFNYIHADLLFRAGNYLVPYLHAGYAHLGSATPAGGLGIMIPLQLGSRVSIIPDVKATALNGAAFTDGIKKLGVNISATIGIQVALGKVKKATPSTSADIPLPLAVTDTQPEAVQDMVADAVQQDRITPEESAEGQVREYPSFTETAYFETNSYTIDAAAKRVLDKALAFLRKYPDSTALIEGHADSTGTEQLNQTLSANRAQNVADYFVRLGIDPSRISCESYGETRPTAPNITREGRASNRRVVITIKTE